MNGTKTSYFHDVALALEIRALRIVERHALQFFDGHRFGSAVAVADGAEPHFAVKALADQQAELQFILIELVDLRRQLGRALVVPRKRRAPVQLHV